jgi:hypothetical protein
LIPVTKIQTLSWKDASSNASIYFRISTINTIKTKGGSNL